MANTANQRRKTGIARVHQNSCKNSKIGHSNPSLECGLGILHSVMTDRYSLNGLTALESHTSRNYIAVHSLSPLAAGTTDQFRKKERQEEESKLQWSFTLYTKARSLKRYMASQDV